MADNSNRKLIAEKLRYYRKRANLKQHEIADMLGIKRCTYARYETGTQPSIETLTKLSEIFNATIEQLTKEDVDYVKQMANTSRNTITVRLAASIPYNTNPNSYNYDLNDSSITEITETEYELIKNFRNLPLDKQDEILDIINQKTPD